MYVTSMNNAATNDGSGGSKHSSPEMLPVGADASNFMSVSGKRKADGMCLDFVFEFLFGGKIILECFVCNEFKHLTKSMNCVKNTKSGMESFE